MEKSSLLSEVKNSIVYAKQALGLHLSENSILIDMRSTWPKEWVEVLAFALPDCHCRHWA